MRSRQRGAHVWWVSEPTTPSERRRVFRRAAVAWQSGKPHTAWEILAESGFQDEWPRFRKVALRIARGRFTAAMARVIR